ncbi:hypothetical protein NE237_022862 [Protea cynaroides]|uniref:Uncharacterized protein n=1 Tax=Protea cynaroides TaxID=273540 RepID=A0A9Q0HB69_9MAGN|nr:hypothetical protein NE237_022862 [Protea cynaroides]
MVSSDFPAKKNSVATGPKATQLTVIPVPLSLVVQLQLNHSGPRFIAICLSTVFLYFLNYTCLAIVGYTVVLCCISLIPFYIMVLLPWKSVNPKDLPQSAVIGRVLDHYGYLVLLLAATGALELEQERWDGGFLAEAAGMVISDWLKFWIEIVV